MLEQQAERLITVLPAGRDHGKALALLGGLYVCVVLLAQLWVVVDPGFLHEQQRILFNYYRAVDPAVFAGDYLTSVLDAASRPYLYSGLTRLWLLMGGDLIVLNRVIPAVCWLVFLAGLAVAARAAGNRLTILAVVALAVAQPVYLHQIAGSTPHAFAFPLLAWGLVALLYASTRGLVVVTLLSGLIYEAMTPMLGLMLAWHILVAGRFFARPRGDQVRSLIVLSLTGAVAVWLVLQSMQQPRDAAADLGRPLEPMQQVDLYPETGPDGPYGTSVFNPAFFVLIKAVEQFRTEDSRLPLLIVIVCLIVMLYGFITLPRGPLRRALTGFALCALAAGLMIFLMKPFHSYRFIFYPLFTLSPLMMVVGLQILWRRFERLRRHADVLLAVSLVPLLCSFDSLNTKKFGYWVELRPETKEILAFAAAQPPDTLFAIWPNGRDAFDFIPYVARRPLFVMVKMHFPTHENHVLRMRERTYALIDAYLATEVAPIQALHCRWGVDYLVVDKSHFAAGGQRPDYFAPFGDRISDIWDRHRPQDFYLSHPEPGAVTVDTADYAVVDLAFLARGGGCGGSAEAGKAD